MPDRSLDSLSSEFLPLAMAWIARCTERGIAVCIVQTSRTQEEHQVNLLNGTSSTAFSLHLPRKMRWRPEILPLADADREKADAMDLAPFEQFQLHGQDKLQWLTSDPAWGILAEEAEKLGLRSGCRWKKPFDPGHAEYVLPWKAAYLADERARPWPYPRIA